MSTFQVTNNFISDLLTIADKNGIEYECFEGSLQDNFVFYHADKIRIENKSAKYIIVKERFLNEWSSDLVLTLTNSDRKAEEFRSIFEQ